MAEGIHLTTKTVIALLGVGLFGAIVHAVNAFKKGEKPSLPDFFINTLTSSFSGLMFGLLAFYSFSNIVIILMVTGIGAYLGIEGLGIVVKFVQSALRITIEK